MFLQISGVSFIHTNNTPLETYYNEIPVFEDKPSNYLEIIKML